MDVLFMFLGICVYEIVTLFIIELAIEKGFKNTQTNCMIFWWPIAVIKFLFKSLWRVIVGKYD